MEPHIREKMQEHFADLTNQEILGQLTNTRTVRLLEETLGDDVLPELKALKERDLDPGPKLTHEHIETYFPEIKQSVDALLEIDGPIPEVWIQTFGDRNYLRHLAEMALIGGGMMGYLGTSLVTLDFTPALKALAIGESIGIGIGTLVTLLPMQNFYDPQKENISMLPSNLGRARGVMAHEYTHRVQDGVGIPLGRRFTYLTEGMAEGVRKEVGKDTGPEDDNVRYENLRSRFHHMQGAYRLLSKRLGLKPKKELTQEGHLWVQPFEKMYAFGTAFFHMQELEKGPRVYRDLTNRAHSHLVTVTGV